ncbi:carboxymuconolactone decarboxylase family protein [Aquimarina gracilis]|uniref:Carboxymuconolactone decarboxylase family protein n=1 Tax=Aquimarina gracilis TaxID=874422 RepID=A0ABU5ZTZ8_9FLAO|nr:carboxymuconolactone decarboxylase family protein [Aquimarina gracilis]MEB3345560.1 carboxymuconolactone decarboxylase family protein [Aquimarina gracilis]
MERITYNELPKGMFDSLREIEEYLKNSPLDFNLLELIKLRVSQLNGCAYCLDMHHKELKHHGENDVKLSLLSAWEETDFFTDKEKAALSFAEALTMIDHRSLRDSIFERLEKHFSKTEISYLSLTITQINTWNRLMKVFGFKAGYYEVAK